MHGGEKNSVAISLTMTMKNSQIESEVISFGHSWLQIFATDNRNQVKPSQVKSSQVNFI